MTGQHTDRASIRIESLDRRMKWGLLIISLATIAFLVAAALRENLFAEWPVYRARYAAVLEEKAVDERGRFIAEQFEIRIVQSYLPELGRVDRCVTCHAGVDDPRMAQQPQPYRTHPGRHVEIHPPETFGCTICHDGQGRSTEAADAHGRVAHWDYPMLERDFLTTTCTRCHEEEDLFGEEGLFRRATGDAGVEAEPAENLVELGQILTGTRGCLGCHAVGDSGSGSIGPDLIFEGDKTRHDLDFSHVGKDEPREVAYWHRKHFLEPEAVAPGTSMRKLGLTPREADALTAYMLSLRRKVTSRYLMRRRREREPEPLSGAELFQKYCGACHGEGGRGGVDNPNYARGTVPPLNTLAEKMFLEDEEDVEYVIELLREGTDITAMSPPLDVPASRRVLAQYNAARDVIRKGSRAAKADEEGRPPPLQMPSWGERLTERDIASIIAYLLEVYPWDEEDEDE
ncbi:MAG: c-type cytochrome [Planctomycetota bacterium]